MKTVWPEKAGCLCARMSRGFNGQDAMGLIVAITLRGKQSANLYMGGGKYLDGKAV